jgi:hypothetical protein
MPKRRKNPGRGRLTRTRNTYEFIVQEPYGASAINGYRRAARHFGFRTLEDPTFGGSDAYRLLIHEDARKLRAAAKVLCEAYSSGDQNCIDEAESWLASASGVNWLSHDWKYWDSEQDEGTLGCLGWKRRVVEVDGRYRVALRRAARCHEP